MTAPVIPPTPAPNGPSWWSRTNTGTLFVAALVTIAVGVITVYFLFLDHRSGPAPDKVAVSCPNAAEAATMLVGDPNARLNDVGCGYQVPDVGRSVTLASGECVDYYASNALVGSHEEIGRGADFIRVRMTGPGTVVSPVTIRWDNSCPAP